MMSSIHLADLEGQAFKSSAAPPEVMGGGRRGDGGREKWWWREGEGVVEGGRSGDGGREKWCRYGGRLIGVRKKKKLWW